jgi:hypothetical protein
VVFVLYVVINFCEYGDELLRSLKFSKLLDYLSDHRCVEKDCVISGIILTIVILVFFKEGHYLFIYTQCLYQCIKLFCVVLTIVTSIKIAESSTVYF